MNRSILLIAISGLFFCGCKKDKVNNTISNVKITVVSGSGQTAPVGYPVTDSIVIQVTSSGSPAANYEVQFIGSGCNEDLVTDLHTKAGGTVKYAWLMASNQGAQTLRVVAINGNTRVDSVMVNATATAPIGGQLRSACTPNPGGAPQRILQLSTGRLIACFDTQTSLRYSDDNGKSWYPLKGFGASHTVWTMATSPQDEIFVGTVNEGVFYSKDAGVTWTNITPATFDKQDEVYDIAYTTNGKLIFTGLSNDIYTSTDKGKTWNHASGLPNNSAYGNPIELSNGDLYMVSFTNILYRSADVGKTWTAMSLPSSEHITSIYADKNGGFYKVSAVTGREAILLSTDNGATFNNFLIFANPGDQPYIDDISIQPDGYLYFGILSYSIGRVYGINLSTETYALSNAPFAAYIVTKDNHFLYANNGGISYY